MKKLNLTLATMAAVTLIGCGGGGGGGGSSDLYKTQTVSYTLNGSNLPTCPNAGHITSSKAQNGDDIGVQQCMWYCGSYQGASPVTVSLTFIQNGKDGVWAFDGETIMTAPQQCHN
jgi:hypothetical protein